MKAGLNLGGPSPKAKYSLATDSALSRATERWKEPLLGEALNLKPYAYNLSEGYGRGFAVQTWIGHPRRGRRG